MKYILMMNTMKAGCGVPDWPRQDLQAHIAFMIKLAKDLRESGELVSAEGLSFPDQASWFAPATMASRSPTEFFRNRRSSLPASGSSRSPARSVPTLSPRVLPRLLDQGELH
jgi:hypothetical protein